MTSAAENKKLPSAAFTWNEVDQESGRHMRDVKESLDEVMLSKRPPSASGPFHLQQV